MLEKIVEGMPRAENPYSALLRDKYEEWRAGMLKPGITYDHFIENALTTGAELNALIGGYIIPLVGKEKLWQECEEAQCQLLVEEGWRKVVEDAELPKFNFSEEPPNMRFGYQEAQQDMLKDGWRKVLNPPEEQKNKTTPGPPS